MPRNRVRGFLLVLAVATLSGLVAAGLIGSRVGLQIRSAEAALNRDAPEEAVAILRPLARDRPDDPQVNVLLARAWTAQGRPEAAIRLLESRWRERVEPIELEELGEVYLELGRMDRALGVYQALYEHGFRDLAVLQRLAELNYQVDQLNESLRLYRQLAELEPGEPEWRRLQGMLLIDMDRYELAVRSFQSVVEQEPDDVETRFRLAEGLFLVGRLEAGLRHLNHCLEVRREPRFLTAAAECLRGLGRSDEAARLLDEVLANRSDDSRALRLRAELCLEVGAWSQALELLECAEAAAPEDWRIQYQLSIAHGRLGQDDEAREHAERMQNLQVKSEGNRP